MVRFLLNRRFLRDGTHVAKKPMKRWPLSLDIREMQIELRGGNALYPRDGCVQGTGVNEAGGRSLLPGGRAPWEPAWLLLKTKAKRRITKGLAIPFQPVHTPQRLASACSHRNLSHVYKGLTCDNRNIDGNNPNAQQVGSG